MKLAYNLVTEISCIQFFYTRKLHFIINWSLHQLPTHSISWQKCNINDWYSVILQLIEKKRSVKYHHSCVFVIFSRGPQSWEVIYDDCEQSITRLRSFSYIDRARATFWLDFPSPPCPHYTHNMIYCLIISLVFYCRCSYSVCFGVIITYCEKSYCDETLVLVFIILIFCQISQYLSGRLCFDRVTIDLYINTSNVGINQIHGNISGWKSLHLSDFVISYHCKAPSPFTGTKTCIRT